MIIYRYPTFTRNAFNIAGVADHETNKQDFARLCGDTAVINSVMSKIQTFFRVLLDSLAVNDTFTVPVLFIRSVSETQCITDKFTVLKGYVRSLYDEAGNMAETTRQGEFYRNESDTVQVKASVFRGLLIFAKILTTSLVRDFILRRFLIAREELVLKSCVTRELTIESKIN
jgi:hypothetical protein